MKGLLKPMVCDCAKPDSTAQQCPSDEDGDEGASPMELASTNVTSSARKAASAANGDDVDSTETPAKRTLERREANRDPLELIEPQIDESKISRSDKERRKKLIASFPLPEKLPERSVLLHANFDPDEGLEVALVEPGRRIQIFSQTERLADLKFSENTVDARPESFEQSGTAAIKIVRDGSAQILTHWTESHEDGSSSYKMGVFKLVESFVGTAFEAELASRAADKEQFESQGTYEFLRGDEHAFIRWIPAADQKGDFDASKAAVYKWNKWEGVYRLPKPPPTAPDRKQVRSGSQRPAWAEMAVK